MVSTAYTVCPCENSYLMAGSQKREEDNELMLSGLGSKASDHSTKSHKHGIQLCLSIAQGVEGGVIS